MPVLDVSGLPQRHPEKIEPALKKTCAAIAEVYGCKPEQVWATWQELRPGHYVEGANSASLQPETSHPPIARITCFEGKSPEVIEKVLLIAGQTLSHELGVPDNIFITYEEAKSGRVISGNGIIRRSR